MVIPQVQCGSIWLNGGGVNVCYNGGNATNDYGASCFTKSGGTGGSGCSSGTVYIGEEWQCVELVNRLYFTKGWLTSVLSGNGNTIINDVHNHSSLSSQNDGSISYLNPGDVITLDDGGFGHAGVIDSIGSGTYPIHIRNQNADLDSYAKVGSGSLSGGNADLEMNGWATYGVQAVVHHPSGSTDSSAIAPQSISYSGNLNLFTTGGDGQVYTQYWNGSSWSGYASIGSSWTGFSSLGGTIIGDPSAISYSTYGEYDIWADTSGGDTFRKTWTGSSWVDWTDYGGTFAGNPYVVQYGNDMYVFARAKGDNTIWKKYWGYSGGSWNGWNQLGTTTMAGDPSAYQYGTSELDTFVTGSDTKTYKDTYNGSSWGGFSSMN